MLSTIDNFANLFIQYYHGSCIHLDQRWHGYNQICVYSKFYYIIQGECQIKIGNTVYSGIPRRFFYIPAGTEHSFYHRNENFITKHWLHFKLEIGGDSINKYYSLPNYVDIDDNSNLEDCFQAINQPCFSLSDDLRRNSKIIELFSIYLSICEKNLNITRLYNNDDFSNVLRYIKSNLNKKMPIKDLADILHIHPNYFIRMFKRKMGMTTNKYINSLRCETAKSLLEYTIIPINSIMLIVGFEDNSTFSHFFRQHTGYSPNAFRKFFSKPPS